MSWMQRNTTICRWSKDKLQLILEDNAATRFIILVMLFLVVPLINITTLAYRSWNHWSLSFFVSLSVCMVFLLLTYLTTTSLKKRIPIEDIEMAILKGSGYDATVNIKLRSGKYRQIICNNPHKLEELKENLQSHSIPTQTRSLYWSMPLNY
jgi:hypothetical protein